MISRQFDPSKPLVPTPKPPKVKSSGPKQIKSLKPIPTPEEKTLMLAKAKKLDAETASINRQTFPTV